MSLAEKVIQNLKILPKSKQIEVLDFIEYLREKIEKQDNRDWDNFSISAAIREMENESSPYSLNDLKEIFS